ncbi:MAG: DUF4124 domain-containing protein [Deltaproteobacteria bacterium]|nr:DUF4124 domain-containing protein [Deltaproteobacteria bacterium]
MQGIKFILVAICLVVLMSPIAFASELYKWVDKNHVVHVIDDPAAIPPEYQEGVDVLKNIKKESENKKENPFEKSILKKLWKE